MSKLRIGLIGIGGICKGAHISAYLKMTEQVEIVALCDIRVDRAEYAKETWFNDADVYEDYRELLKDETIDAVDICTPNYKHAEIAVAALNAGKHVMCEKPDAVSVEAVLDMQKAAKDNNKTLMVMRNNRFTDASAYAKKYINAGKMGDIYCGRCGWIRRRGIPGKGGWFTTKAESGGGPLIDLGVHMIDLAIYLMGNPTPVAVSGSTYCKFANSKGNDSEHSKFGDANSKGTFDVEDLAMGMIKFDNGATLQIEFSWASNIGMETRFVELRGTKAGLTWQDEQLKIFTEDVELEPGRLIDYCPKLQQKIGGHEANLRHFVDVVVNGTEPCYKPQQGVDMIKILSAIYESAETGFEVRL